MFATTLALLATVAFVNGAAVKSLKPDADPVHGQGNWTLHAIAPTKVILDDSPVPTLSSISASLVSGELKMYCPYPDYRAVLVPVEGTDPTQYTFEFAKADAELAEGSITDGWTQSDLTDDYQFPDLQKVANSKAGEGVFDMTSANFDFPSLTWKPAKGKGYEVVLDYAHEPTC
ncbi:hypothetical protein EV714DRAFT_254375 [Schizophyllum commune]